MLYKCKMCGGDLEIQIKQSVCECIYCGTTQTIPNVDEAKILNFYNRATYFLNSSEYDKASLIFEQIIQEDCKQAEAYWGVCLCKYGIEYVVDPKTHLKIATCHRMLTSSILKDADYLKTLELADSIAKDLYKKEAKYIDTIQKKMLAICNSEEPYDIFICYKETDCLGNRTIDSVIAEEIFDSLCGKGYRVFFAKISLQDKLGQDYEPYIFSAIKSAKVMLVIGSKEEYFNAPWVKNEWSRFLKLKDAGKKKYLIPCYKGVSTYQMPKEFINLQSQDLSKLGYLQDLIKGIDKLIEKQKKSAIEFDDKGKIHELFSKIKSSMKQKDFEEAKLLCDQILILDKQNAQCYYLKYLIFANVSEFDFVNYMDTSCYSIFSEEFDLELLLKTDINPDFNFALEYADAEYAKYLKRHMDWITKIKQMIKNKNLLEKYNSAKEFKKKAKTLDEYRKLISLFEELGDYEDSKRQVKFYKKKIFKDDFEDFIYNSLIDSIRPIMTLEEKEFIKSGFEKLGDYRDSKKYVEDFKLTKSRTKHELESEIEEAIKKKDNLINENFELIELDKLKKMLILKKEQEKKRIVCNSENKIKILSEKIENIKTEIQNVTKEIESLGFFFIQRKKILNKRLNMLIAKLIKIRKDKSKIETELKKALNDEIIAINDKYDLEIKKIEIEESSIIKKNSDISNIISEIEATKLELKKLKDGADEKNLWDRKVMTIILDSLGYKIVRFVLGKYPSKKVSSEAVIYELNKISPNSKSIYKFNGLEFVKKMVRFTLFYQ